MATTTAASVGRIGGLAVALGIGAAVATGLAASAWAAPDGPADDRSARAATSTAAPGQARTAAVRPAATRAVSAGPTRRPAGQTPNPAATNGASAPRPAAALAPRASAVPVVAAPADAVAPTPARATVAQRSARQLSLWPDSRGRLITIYKRTHFAIPNNFGFFVQKVTGTGTFTTNSAYDLGDEDQYDWNKFTGIAFTPLEPDRDSVMVGWRYNLNTQKFEIAPFYNVDKKRILPNENPNSPGYEVISVPVDEPFNFLVDYTGVTLSYGGRTVFKPFPEGLTPNVWTAARVSGWFGGNEVAPRTISYFIRFA